MRRSLFSVSALLLLAVLFTGCKDETLAPFAPEIGNQTGSFQFQVTEAKDVTTVLNYSWQNDAEVANVNQACAITSGEGTLTVLDANQQVMYSRNLMDNGTYASSTGASGLWTIRVTLKNTYGTINFRVQSP
jgi:hypothetical protein